MENPGYCKGEIESKIMCLSHRKKITLLAFFSQKQFKTSVKNTSFNERHFLLQFPIKRDFTSQKVKQNLSNGSMWGLFHLRTLVGRIEKYPWMCYKPKFFRKCQPHILLFSRTPMHIFYSHLSYFPLRPQHTHFIFLRTAPPHKSKAKVICLCKGYSIWEP